MKVVGPRDATMRGQNNDLAPFAFRRSTIADHLALIDGVLSLFFPKPFKRRAPFIVLFRERAIGPDFDAPSRSLCQLGRPPPPRPDFFAVFWTCCGQMFSQHWTSLLSRPRTSRHHADRLRPSTRLKHRFDRPDNREFDEVNSPITRWSIPSEASAVTSNTTCGQNGRAVQSATGTIVTAGTCGRRWAWLTHIARAQVFLSFRMCD